jgi:DNA-binding beta-propeller fold protein YncE
MRFPASGAALLAAGFLLSATILSLASGGAKRSLAASSVSAPPLQIPPGEGPMAPEFPEGMEWLNTDRPLTLKELRGKIVLLDFWTYCCINCIHIIPDLKRLEAKYARELVVIGVHSAKFQNEKEAENIRDAILRYEIEHPVLNDRDFRVWNAYGAHAWPTLVLIDPDGRVVGARSGEGVYEPFDRAISALIRTFEPTGRLDRKPLRFTLEKDRSPKSVLSFPGKLIGDAKSGRLFVADSNRNRVIVLSLSGAIQEVIGEGQAGLTDGDFAAAQFNKPQGLAFDAAANLLYVADCNNHAIRRIDLNARKVTTLAGNGRQADYPPTGGVGRAVSLSSPWDVLLKGNTLYIAMAGMHQLWTLDLKTLRAAPYAGTGGEDIQDGPLSRALLAQPSGLTTDGQRIYFADSEVSAVRSADIGGKGEVRTLIGTGLFHFGDVDGAYPRARLQHPLGVAYRNGYVYIADAYNHKVKRVHVKTRTLETVIGTGKRGMQDGPAKQATLNEPNGVFWVGDKLYIADTNNHLIRVYNPASGRVSTLRLSGLEKLTLPSMPAFLGSVERFPTQEVAPETKTLWLEIELPKGTKFNPGAPFRIRVVSDRPQSIAVGTLNITQGAHRLSLPITPKSGEATLTVEMSINYCAEGNEGLCYYKEARLAIPLRVAAGGSSSPSVKYILYR